MNHYSEGLLTTDDSDCTDDPLYPLDPCSFCHLELVERSFFYLFIYPFLAHSEKRTKRMAQKYEKTYFMHWKSFFFIIFAPKVR